MKVTILGNIASDINTRQAGNTVVATFDVSERKAKVNEGDKKTNYWRVTVFGKTVEMLVKFFHKGSPICITGNADWHEYTGKDGVARKSVEVTANSVDFVPKEYAPNENTAGYKSPQYNNQQYTVPQQSPQPTAAPQSVPAPAPAPVVSSDDELPF